MIYVSFFFFFDRCIGLGHQVLLLLPLRQVDPTDPILALSLVVFLVVSLSSSRFLSSYGSSAGNQNNKDDSKNVQSI